MSNLKGKNIVLTGAGSGVGRAIALELALHGANLCLVGRNKKNLETVLETVGIGSSSSRIYVADLSLDDDIQRLTSSIHQDFKNIDTLIHSAAILKMGSFEAQSIEDFDRQYKINVRAPYLLTQLFLSSIKLRRGTVVFINSSSGLTAKANFSQYSATKHALKAVADTIREEAGSDDIRVLSIYLGPTATPMQIMIHEIEGKPYSPEKLLQPEDVARTIINALALPQTAEVTDISIRPTIK